MGSGRLKIKVGEGSQGDPRMWREKKKTTAKCWGSSWRRNSSLCSRIQNQRAGSPTSAGGRHQQRNYNFKVEHFKGLGTLGNNRLTVIHSALTARLHWDKTTDDSSLNYSASCHRHYLRPNKICFSLKFHSCPFEFTVRLQLCFYCLSLFLCSGSDCKWSWHISTHFQSILCGTKREYDLTHEGHPIIWIWSPRPCTASKQHLHSANQQETVQMAAENTFQCTSHQVHVTNSVHSKFYSDLPAFPPRALHHTVGCQTRKL